MRESWNRWESGFLRIKIYLMSVITIEDKKYYSIDQFMLIEQIRSEKTVYNRVNAGTVEQKKMFNKSFFRNKV